RPKDSPRAPAGDPVGALSASSGSGRPGEARQRPLASSAREQHGKHPFRSVKPLLGERRPLASRLHPQSGRRHMAGGLVGLFDDVAALAKLAAASVDDIGAAAGRASMKTAGVVIDDAPVTPGYVRGLAAERELPIIRRIATASLRNKLVIILPLALLLSS